VLIADRLQVAPKAGVSTQGVWRVRPVGGMSCPGSGNVSRGVAALLMSVFL
jgi:hypothetical protein